MSATRGSGAGNGGGAQPIPAGSRKMVLSLKEIVNYSDAEIYATLKECNMDPNEAVNRLLSQDPFHEVKSKREKKKEGKDNTESKPRGTTSNSSRGGKMSSERYLGRGSSAPHNSSVSGLGNGRSRGLVGSSDGFTAENKGHFVGANDDVPSVFVPPAKFSWISAPGQVSMADVLKMGRQYSNGPSSQSPSDHVLLNRSYEELKNPESGISSVQNAQPDEEWPSMEKHASSTVFPSPEYEHRSEVSYVHPDPVIPYSELKGTQEDIYSIENPGGKEVGSESISSGKIPDDGSSDPSAFNLYGNMNQPQTRGLHEVNEITESASSITSNLQQLSLKEDRSLLSEGCVPSVVIPDHLQVHDADCSHLSFGSFGAGMSIAHSSGAAESEPLKINLEEEPQSAADISSVGHAETRSPEYHVDGSLRNASTGGLFHSTVGGPSNYDPSPVSKPEELKQENSELEHRYSFPQANAGYNFDAQHLNATFNRTSSQMQDLASFSNSMSYTNYLPPAFSSSSAQLSREPDLQYSPFSSTQSLSSKYGNSVTPSVGSSMVAPEASRTTGTAQPASVAASGTSGSPLPQHLPVHPYSQLSLPLGPFSNVITYPYLPPSYTYMPSAFQQNLASSNAYPQSLAGLLPQYKNSVSPSNLPQSAAVASGYGGSFRGTPSTPGNFPMNSHAAAPSATGLNYDDVLNAAYKDNSQLISLLQNENPAVLQWLQGPNSRSMSAVPSNRLYSYQANQQQGMLRQAQQPQQQQHQQHQPPSHNYGGPGYPNFYQSPTSLSPEQPPQNGGAHGQSKQAQIWQSGY